MVRVSFSTTVAADSSSQYDGDSADREPEKADSVRREGPGLTAAQSNGKKGRTGCFRRRTRIGNDAHDGRLSPPMGQWRRTFVETWRGKVMLDGAMVDQRNHDVIQVRGAVGGMTVRDVIYTIKKKKSKKHTDGYTRPTSSSCC